MKTLKRRLEESLKGFYLLSGDDVALMDRAYNAIKQKCGIDDAGAFFDLAAFNDENFSAKEVIDSANGMPMTAVKKLVVLKNITKLSEADKKLFKAYAALPNELSVLVVYDEFATFDFLKTNVEFVDCKRFKQEDLIKLISFEAKKYGKTISQRAAVELIDRCNYYYTNIINEVKKLAFYDDGEMITLEAVEKSVHKELEFVVFELTEALSRRDGEKSIGLLHLMEKEPGTFALLANHFRRLFFAGISEGTNAEIAAGLGVKEYAITKAKMAAKNFSKKQLKEIYERVEEVDFMIKSGKMAQKNALYFLVFSILNA